MRGVTKTCSMKPLERFRYQMDSTNPNTRRLSERKFGIAWIVIFAIKKLMMILNP